MQNGKSHSLASSFAAPAAAKTLSVAEALNNNIALKDLADLLRQGADPNEPDAEWRTPMDIAIEKQWWGAAELLLKAGAEPDATDRDGKAVAHWAAIYDQTRILSLLKSLGADIQKADEKYGLTPLHWACMNGRLRVAAHILSDAPPEVVNRHGGECQATPLHLAAGRRGSAELLKMLIGQGAFVNVTDKNGITPLGYASGQKDFEMVRTLVENGTDISCVNCDEDKNSLLFSIANGPNKESGKIVKLLLDQGAEPNISAVRDVNGANKNKSLLYYAIEYAHFHTYDVARALLEAGADPHATSHTGESAMHHCLALRQIEGVKLLLEFSFDPLKPFNSSFYWLEKSEHRPISAYNYAQELVAKFGDNTEYGEMLHIIETHLHETKTATVKRKKSKEMSP